MGMNIVKFQTEQLSVNVDTVMIDGCVWFKGKDVARALDYSNTRQATLLHVEDEDKATLE